MKYKITYWDAGDRLVSREVEADNQEAAINSLVEDPQNPLSQVQKIEIVNDESEK